jgi:hypothetical protein
MTAAQTSVFPPPTAVEQVNLRFLGDALSCHALDGSANLGVTQ